MHNPPSSTSGTPAERARCQHCRNLADERSFMCEDCAGKADTEVQGLREALEKADALADAVIRWKSHVALEGLVGDYMVARVATRGR